MPRPPRAVGDLPRQGDRQEEEKPALHDRDDASALAEIRHRGSLRLVILNSCAGARTAQDDPFSSAAAVLVQQASIPAVVAMQFEITDTAALVFAHSFYTSIAKGYPVDAVLAEARKSIFALPNDVE